MFHKILSSCKFVASESQFVSIHYDSIEKVVKNMKGVNSKHWLEDSPFGILDFEVEDIVNFLLVYHGMGFSYWGTPKWTISTEKGDVDGAFAMMYLLIKKLKEDKKFFTAEPLMSISKEELRKLLKGNVEIPLFEQRYTNLVAIGKVVQTEMGGNFYRFIKDISSDEELFQLIIDKFSTVFSDVTTYKGEKVYFYKLAQLLTSDILHIESLKEEVVVDYTHLLGCADYKIPQVLRSLGILQYTDELAQVIDNKQEIDKDSEAEIEIRVNMIVAIHEISKRTKNICPIEVNDLLWLMGQEKKENIKPYHLTRTRFY